MPIVSDSGGRRERFPRLIVQLIISYGIIVSLGAGFFILPAQNAVRLLREQSLVDQTATVQRYARSADSALALFSNIATAFLSDQSMFSLAHGQSDNPNQDYYRILMQLTQYNKLYGNIFNQMYVYDSARDNLLSLTGLSKAQDFFNQKLNPYAYMTRDSFDRIVTRGTPNEPRVFAEGDTVYVVHTLPFNYPDDRYLLVAFSVPLENLFGISAKYQQTPAQCGVYFSATEGFIGNTAGISDSVTALAAQLNSSSVHIDDAPNQDTLFLIRAARNDRFYFFVMPQNTYNNQVASFSRFLTFSLIAFVFVSVLIVLLSVCQQYKPLRRLLAEIDNDSIDSLSTHDYGIILDYLSGLKKERDDYRNLLVERKPRLRRLLLSSLLTDNSLAEEKAEESLRLLEIGFPYPFFVVVVMDVLDDSQLFFSAIDNPEEYSMFLIENVLCDLVPEDSKPVFFPMDDSLVCLLNLNVAESPQITLDALQDKLLFAADFLQRELNLTCRYAVSSLHNSTGALATAYEEALACTQGLHMRDQLVLLYDRLQSPEPQTFEYLTVYSGEQAKRLVSALRTGQPDKAQAIVRQVFGEVQSRSGLHPLLYKSVCRGMACSFVEALSEMSVTSDALEHRLFELLDADTRTVSLRAMEDKMLALCADVAVHVRSDDIDKQERLFREIQAYVTAHYADPGLGVTSIADVFSMSISGLSSFFGRNNDIGLCKYINRVRIQHACQLLSECPAMPLEEIATQVGYTNTRTFSRVFSAEMQCSPGKYRQQAE